MDDGGAKSGYHHSCCPAPPTHKSLSLEMRAEIWVMGLVREGKMVCGTRGGLWGEYRSLSLEFSDGVVLISVKITLVTVRASFCVCSYCAFMDLCCSSKS